MLSFKIPTISVSLNDFASLNLAISEYIALGSNILFNLLNQLRQKQIGKSEI